MKKVEWRIWYGDKTYFDSTMGSPFDIERRVNVQLVVGRHRAPSSDPYSIGRYIVSQKHFYWWEGEDWWGGDIFGLWDYLTRPGPKVVLFGRSLTGAQWREVYQLAHDDPDFPNKSAYLKDEYHPARARAQDEANADA